MNNSKGPTFAMLPQDKLNKIVEEAFMTLERIGIFVENEEAVELLSGGGAKISDDCKRAYIPGDLIERVLKTVPDHITLYDREGNKTADVGANNVLFDPGSAALFVYDFAEHRIRKPLTRDVVEFALLSDHLKAFEAQSTGVIPSDLPEELADRFRLFIALVYGRKPIVTGTFTKDAFSTMLSLLTAARGSRKALKEKPLAIFDCCPSPPLMWSDLTCQALIDCAKNRIPAELVSMPLTGATAPVTLAGALVQHTAENLSGIVIHQLAGPGSPIIYGGSPACFDMRKGTTPMGAVETMMIDCAYAQIGKHFGLPVHAYMGLSDSKMTDYQAGLETAMGMTLAALAGVSVVSGAGMLSFESCQSLEKLLIDNEIAAMAKRLMHGIAFEEKVLGFDVLDECTEKKSFLTSEHTRRFFRREAYYPSDVIDRSTQGEWEKKGALSAPEKAHNHVRSFLRSPEISFPEEAILKELISIMEADAVKHGLSSLPTWRIYDSHS